MYYENQAVKGKVEFNSLFNGEEAPNYDLYDGLTHICSGRCYCRECDKYLGNNLRNTVSKGAEKLLNVKNNLVCHGDTERKLL